MLQHPHYTFYDVASNANIAVRTFGVSSRRVGLVVVFVVGAKGVRVVTVYPVREVRREIGRKVNSGRWILSSGGQD